MNQINSLVRKLTMQMLITVITIDLVEIESEQNKKKNQSKWNKRKEMYNENKHFAFHLDYIYGAYAMRDHTNLHFTRIFEITWEHFRRLIPLVHSCYYHLDYIEWFSFGSFDWRQKRIKRFGAGQIERDRQTDKQTDEQERVRQNNMDREREREGGQEREIER